MVIPMGSSTSSSTSTPPPPIPVVNTKIKLKVMLQQKTSYSRIGAKATDLAQAGLGQLLQQILMSPSLSQSQEGGSATILEADLLKSITESHPLFASCLDGKEHAAVAKELSDKKKLEASKKRKKRKSEKEANKEQQEDAKRVKLLNGHGSGSGGGIVELQNLASAMASSENSHLNAEVVIEEDEEDYD